MRPCSRRLWCLFAFPQVFSGSRAGASPVDRRAATLPRAAPPARGGPARAAVGQKLGVVGAEADRQDLASRETTFDGNFRDEALPSRPGHEDRDTRSDSDAEDLSLASTRRHRKRRQLEAFDGKARPEQPNAFLPMSRAEGMKYSGVRNLTRDHVLEQLLIAVLACAITASIVFGFWYATDRVNLTHPPNAVRVDPVTGEDLPRPFQFLREEKFQDRVENIMEILRENTFYLASVLAFNIGQSLLFVIKIYDNQDEVPWFVLLFEAVVGFFLFLDPLLETLQLFTQSEFGTLEKVEVRALLVDTVTLLTPILSVGLSQQDSYDREAGTVTGGGFCVFWYSFRFLAIMRLRKYYLLMFPELRGLRSPVARASYALMLRFFEVFTFFYVVVSLLWTVEFAEGLFARHVPTAHAWTLDAGLWFVSSSAMTIGYGDYAPVTVLGRLTVMVFLVSVLLMVGLVADILTRIWAESASGMGRYHVRARVPYIILCGNFAPATARSILAEFFHDDQHDVHRDRMEIVFVLVGQQFLGVAQAVGEWVKENVDFGTRVHVLRGNITDTYDYRRCAVATARAVLVVPNVQNPVDKQKEDVDTLLRVQAVMRRSPPSLHVIVILHLMRNRYMFLGILPRRNLLCADDFKFRMIGRISFVPGLPSLLCSLLQCSSMSDKDRSLFKSLDANFQDDASTKNQFTLFHNDALHFGQGKELYALPLNPSYAHYASKTDHIPWSDIVRDILYRSKNKDVLLLGYIRYDPAAEASYLKFDKEVIFFPPDHDLAFTHPTKTKVLGIFIASDAFDVRQRPSMEVFMLPEVDSDEEDFDEAYGGTSC
eukprot:g9196.t1